MFASHAASAANIVVTHGGDTGTAFTCTLRQAVQAANTNAAVGTCAAGSPGPDTVFLTGVTGTISLGSQIVVNESVTISGPGAATLAISGNHSHRIFDVVDTGTPLAFAVDGLTLANGFVMDDVGGCIRATSANHLGTITVSNSVVTGCVARESNTNLQGGLGGAIFGDGAGADKYQIYGTPSVLVQNSTISGNRATLGGGGVMGVSVRLENSLVSANVIEGFSVTTSSYAKYSGGGGVAALAAIVNNSTISGNQTNPVVIGAAYRASIALGGGLLSGIAVVQNSTVSGNRINGASLMQAGDYNALYGGGIASLLGAQLVNSTISGNIVSATPIPGQIGLGDNWLGGGGLFTSNIYGGSLGIYNSTIAGNTLSNFGPGGGSSFSIGAGLAYFGIPAGSGRASSPRFDRARQIQNSKLVRGMASALVGPASTAAAAPPITIISSIVSNSFGAPDIGCGLFPGTCTTPVTVSGDHNLVMSADASMLLPGGTLTADPMLGLLRDNGGAIAGAPGMSDTGPNKTHALRLGSPALNVGSSAAVPPLWGGAIVYDQRGAGYPRVLGASADIGAVEGAIDQAANVQEIPALGAVGLGLLSGLLGLLAGWRRKALRAGGK